MSDELCRCHTCNRTGTAWCAETARNETCYRCRGNGHVMTPGLREAIARVRSKGALLHGRDLDRVCDAAERCAQAEARISELEAQLAEARRDCGECGHRISDHREVWGCWRRTCGGEVCPCALTPENAAAIDAAREKE